MRRAIGWPYIAAAVSAQRPSAAALGGARAYPRGAPAVALSAGADASAVRGRRRLCSSDSRAGRFLRRHGGGRRGPA